MPLGNVSKTKSLQNLSPITQEIISVDTPNTVKNLFLKEDQDGKRDRRTNKKSRF